MPSALPGPTPAGPAALPGAPALGAPWLSGVFQALVLLALTGVTPYFSDGDALKPLLLFLGLLILWLGGLATLRLSAALLPFAFYWAYSFWKLTALQPHHGEALMLFLAFFAFMLGQSRGFRPVHQLVLLFLMLVLLRGFWDLLAFQHLGRSDWAGSPASFFLSPHAYGAVLLCAVFYHFFLIEGNYLHWAPVRFFIYLSLLLAFYSLFLVNARGAHLGFLFSLLPFLILSLNPHAKKPHAAILVFGAGVAWCVGAFLSLLPGQSFDRAVQLLFPVASEAGLPWESWRAGWEAFLASPWLGHGTGSYAFASLPYSAASGGELPDPFSPAALAQSRYLEVLAEGGILGLGLELGLFLAALFALGHAYLKRGELAAKYAFYALLGLGTAFALGDAAAHPAPLLIYWLLIGFGWSHWEPEDTRAVDSPAARIAAIVTCLALVGFGIYHAANYGRELRADYYYRLAKRHHGDSPREFTNNVIKALSVNPRHGRANYDYVFILARFHKFDEAVQHLLFALTFAPNGPLAEFIQSKMDLERGRFVTAFRMAHALERRYPGRLDNWETMLKAGLGLGRCAQLDSLQGELKRTLLPRYAARGAREYTAVHLDSLYHHDPHLNILQKRIGGEALRDRFFTLKQADLHTFRDRLEMLQSLREIRCGDKEEGYGSGRFGNGRSAVGR